MRNPVCLFGSKKILLLAIFALVTVYYPAAVENTGDVRDKLTPGNIRLTNADSSESVFNENDWLIRSFMNKWKIQGLSIAVAKRR